MAGWRQWARLIRRDVLAVWIAARDPRLPWYVKLLAVAVAAYALSPVDLIPDVVPVLGYLDDLVIVPAGIFLVIRLIPPDLLDEFRVAADALARRPVSRAGLAAMVAVWIAAAALVAWLAWPYLGMGTGPAPAKR
jgi:uncharacterized membrane protein YkvA (DUF1232 family)